MKIGGGHPLGSSLGLGCDFEARVMVTVLAYFLLFYVIHLFLCLVSRCRALYSFWDFVASSLGYTISPMEHMLTVFSIGNLFVEIL